MRQKERCQRKPNKWWSHEKEKEIHYGALSWTVVQQPILGKKQIKTDGSTNFIISLSR